MRAVCHRYLRNFDAALETLARLKALAPDHGRAYQEEGHAYRDSGRYDQALRAYARACRLNPALVASWRSQYRILGRQGLAGQAEQVKAQLDYLERLPKPLVGVMDLIGQGKLLKAEDVCRQFLKKAPHHVEAMRLLANIGIRLGVLTDAEFLLESAHRLEPANVQVHIDYIGALRKRQKFALALDEARRLLETSPDNPQFQSICAIEHMQTGDYEAALGLFDSVLRQIPGDPVTLTSKGHAYKTRGQYDESVAAYRAALASDPQHGEAWYSLSNLKVYSFNDAELARLRTLASSPELSHADGAHLGFALGKACEDRRDFEASFRHYERGNRLKGRSSRYDADKMTAELQAQSRVCTAGMLARGATAGHRAVDPIFVVGLPRAGSTLLEQILSSHSRIDGTLELPNILSLSQQLRRRGRGGAGLGSGAVSNRTADLASRRTGRGGGADGLPASPGRTADSELRRTGHGGDAAGLASSSGRAAGSGSRRSGGSGDMAGYPEILATLSDAELEAFGRQYIDDTRIHRRRAPFFIDKMPNNFRHIGLIHLILPNAKIIDARRHPMACGFSAYKQLFAEGQEFTYDLTDLGRYYRDYVELMDHWDAVLPGKVLRVQYEDVVADLEGQVRRLLDHCGLEFEPGCLSFHRTERAVRTPSSEQVRQPIFTAGLDYWRNYERWLDPLKDALGEDVRRRYGIAEGKP